MLDEIYTLSQHLLGIYQRNYIRYFLKKQKLDNRLSIIVGARGVGKSTMLVQYLLSKYKRLDNEILYVQCDHFIVNKYTLYDIAEAFVNYGGKIICFDEVHKYPQWSMELKSIYDTFPKLKILASGSSALSIYQGSHDLSRRALVYTLYGMSFREFLELNLDIKLASYDLSVLLEKHKHIAAQIIEKIAKKKQKILALFKDYLYCGYYPYFQEFKHRNLFYMTLEQNLHTTIESDLPAIYPNLTGASTRKIAKLLTTVASNVPYTPDLKALKSIIEVGDERTLKTYLKYLSDAGIIILLQKAGKGLTGLEKPEKIYLNNSNQLYALSGETPNIGTVRETFFNNAFYVVGYKTRAAKHADFIIDDKYTFEIGGKNKGIKQIINQRNAYLAVDNIEIGHDKRIPLWVFGLLY